MHRFILIKVSILTALIVISSSCTKDKTKIEDEVICDKEFKLVSPDGKRRELGIYSIKGIARDNDRKVELIEEMSMDYQGKKAEYRSTVIYMTVPSLMPVKGSVETKIDGKSCMKGDVEFHDDTLSLSCFGLLDKKTAEKIDPPKKFEKKNLPKPEGMLVFQSSLPIIGPKLITKEGEFKNVVFIEFPDDLGAPELINFKEDYRIVRDEPDEKGRYYIRIVSSHSDKPVSEARFDTKDKLLTISSLFGKAELVEIKDK